MTVGTAESRMLTFYLLRREGQLRSRRVKLLHLLTTAGRTLTAVNEWWADRGWLAGEWAAR